MWGSYGADGVHCTNIFCYNLGLSPMNLGQILRLSPTNLGQIMGLAQRFWGEFWGRFFGQYWAEPKNQIILMIADCLSLTSWTSWNNSVKSFSWSFTSGFWTSVESFTLDSRTSKISFTWGSWGISQILSDETMIPSTFCCPLEGSSLPSSTWLALSTITSRFL